MYNLIRFPDGRPLTAALALALYTAEVAASRIYAIGDRVAVLPAHLSGAVIESTTTTAGTRRYRVRLDFTGVVTWFDPIVLAPLPKVPATRHPSSNINA